MTLLPATSLCNHRLRPWIVLSNYKREQEHETRGNRQHHIGIDISQRLRLYLQGLVRPRVGLYLRIRHRGPSVIELRGKSAQLIAEGRVIIVGMRGKHRLMYL